MVVARVPHKINGKHYGMFYHFDDGSCLYLAHRSGEKTKSLFFQTMSWCLDVDTLNECERRGVTAIGVAHKVGRRVDFYITNLKDFWNPPSEPHPQGVTRQRRLGREHFKVRMSKSGKGPLMCSVAAKIPV